MVEIAEVQVVLNKAEDTNAPFPKPNGSTSVPEHALSLTGALSAEDPVSLPSIDVNMVSEGFSDLKKEPNAEIENVSQTEQHDSLAPQGEKQQEQQQQQETPTTLSAEAFSPLTPSPPRPQQSQQSYGMQDNIETQPAFTEPGPTTPTKATPSLPSTVGTPLPPKSKSESAPAVQGTSAAWKTDSDRAAKLARERDVAAAFSGLPRVKPQWTHNYMKILIVGDDGLGKTTFTRNLFAAYAANIDFPVADASGHGASTIFSDRPETLCTELAVQDEDSMVYWHYLIQDTPGYGDFDGHEDARAQRKAIIDYIKTCSEQYLDMEINPSRRSSMHRIADTRVDVVLYFLPPHRLRRSDIRFIKLLNQVGVPVVPILSKADSMTPEELKLYRHEVHAALSRHGLWHFSHDALAGAGAHHKPPFAVVGASTIDRSVGRFWPVRRYPWGRCESLLTAHSELPVLRRLLFETAYWELKENTDKEYLKFRRTECSEKFNPVPRPLRALLRIAGGVALTVGALFIVVNAGPLVKDEAVRREAVRKVRSKVNGAVENVSDTVHGVEKRAEETTKTVKSVAGAAVETGKRQALKGAALLETPQVKEAREAVGREVMAAKRPWWKF